VIGAFWLGLAGYLALLASLAWRGLGANLHHDRLLAADLLATGLLGALALVPGRLLTMWPYAIALEPQKGIFVYAPPGRQWIPLDEIVDISAYSGTYGGGHTLQLSRAHGLVREIHIVSLFFPDGHLVNELRAAIDRSDGVVHSS
jgi:hypothetical protein